MIPDALARFFCFALGHASEFLGDTRLRYCVRCGAHLGNPT